MAHVIKTMADTLPDDPWHKYFKSPKWLAALVEKGALGQKTGAGIFRKVGKDIMVLDLEKQDYRPADRKAADEVVEILKTKDPVAKFAALRESGHPQAQFLWAVFRDLFHYSAYHLADIAQTARDVDLAIRWGYGWSLGPFETWQAAGWKQVAQWIADDIVAGKAMSDAPLPDWVFDGRDGVHSAEGSYSPGKNAKLPRSTLPVYKRQRFPDPLLGESFPQGETVFENDGIRLWTDGDDIAVASFKTKMHTVSDQVLDGLQEAIAHAERDFAGKVIWQPKEPFSAPQLGQASPQGEKVLENNGIRLWTDGDDIAVASFKTKRHTVSDQVLDGLQDANGHAERDFAVMVIWQPKEPCSAGADLAGALGLLQAGKVDAFEAMVANFQATSQRIKYSLVPVVAAVRWESQTGFRGRRCGSRPPHAW